MTDKWFSQLMTALLVICAWFTSVPVYSEPLPTVRLCYEQYPQSPYSLGVSQVPQENPGLIIDLVNQALQQAGLSADFYRSSWNRCIDDLRTGQTDGLFSMIWTPQRDPWAVFPKLPTDQVDPQKRLWSGVYRIYVRRDGQVSWDGEQFKGLNFGIGAPLGYLSYKRLSELNALSPLNVLHEEGLQLVAARRIDGYVMDPVVAAGLLKELQLEQEVVGLEIPLLEHPWYLVFSPEYYRDHSDSAERIWAALANVRETEASALVKKYQKLID